MTDGTAGPDAAEGLPEAFFVIHDDLPREGPGEPDDVHWAHAVAGWPEDAMICDAGCGPGADIPALLATAPDGQVIAVDAHAPFAERVQADHGGDRVAAFVGDLRQIGGPFDVIWSAGAVYNVGLEEALAAWRDALAEEGVVVLSHPVFFTDLPTDGARAFWGDHDPLTEAAFARAVADAGWEILDARRLTDAAWEAYYEQLEDRIAFLRTLEDPAEQLAEQLDAHEAEIEGWRTHRHETGYVLAVLRPV